MPAITTYTKPLTAEQVTRLKSVLQDGGYSFESKPYCLYAASKNKLNVLVYEKGPKVLVQGKETQDFVTNVLEPLILGMAELGYEEVHHPEMYEPHIGVDESGKGDFFGPLVIAGVYVDADVARKLRELGVVDSKKISSDAKISQLAAAIRLVAGLRYEIVQINPTKYNELYDKFGNLNRLLAWGHATAIESLLRRVPDCPKALSDQFANPSVLQRALRSKGCSIELVQRTKAESDPAVAAASILARDAFVKWLDQNSSLFAISLPKGVSSAVKDHARKIFAKAGQPGLSTVAKMHFKTASEVCGDISPTNHDDALGFSSKVVLADAKDAGI
jgi:ribonuclease HIII